MWYRRVTSKVAFFAVWAALLLSTASVVFFVSSTGYNGLDSFAKPETQSAPLTDSLRETEVQSIPATGIMQENQSIISPASSTQETGQTPDEIVGPVFYVILHEITVNIGNPFSVFVFAQNVTDMYGWQIRLCFDLEIVQCINVSVPERHVFSNGYPVSQGLIDYNSTEFNKRPLQDIKNSQGYIMAGDCLLGDNQTTFHGSGLLCKITFMAVSSGSSQLALSRAMSDNDSSNTCIIDSLINVITVSVSDSTVTVLP